VSTEIDLNSSYVGGNEECIDRILTDSDLEGFPAMLEDPVHIGADEVNIETS
jgi:hypothetical protein